MAQLSKNGLLVQNNQSFPNNSTGYITPEKLRDYNVDVIDSTVNQSTYDTASAGWDNSISALNTFTASQQPSFNQLNAFTASQLTINSGVNGFTQSADNSISLLGVQTASFFAYTSSIVQIQSNGVTLGTSTRINLVGPGTFFSASLVANVGGPIATLTFTSDNAKLNTASFDTYKTGMDAYTASTDIRLNDIEVWSGSAKVSITNLNSYTSSQNIINSSVTASLTQLLNLSSSLSGGYATQGELDQSASVLQANIDTKLNTASFNAYTQSNDASVSSSINTLSASVSASDSIINGRINTISSFTGSYATTGSNTFIGNQTITGSTIITGSLTITGSVYQNVSAVTISGATASIDFSKANYFTLTLSGSTNINVINAQPGVTATVVINVGISGSATFSSNVKQPSGSAYIPSPSSSTDIISLTSVDTNTVYLVPAYSFV
jgi:hypothetical protein